MREEETEALMILNVASNRTDVPTDMQGARACSDVGSAGSGARAHRAAARRGTRAVAQGAGTWDAGAGSGVARRGGTRAARQ
jgi:hypothetical protein